MRGDDDEPPLWQKLNLVNIGVKKLLPRNWRAFCFVDAEVVFVGYGVDAPEYGWNDYKNVDVKGKVLVMLVNDTPTRLA